MFYEFLFGTYKSIPYFLRDTWEYMDSKAVLVLFK